MSSRHCEICGSGDNRSIYKQQFAPLDDDSTFTGYDVVVCAVCGFGYADNIPPQEFYDRYYREMSKYGAFRPATSVDATHPNYADIVRAIQEHYPDRKIRILDIGTGSGHLLGAFRRAGYENVLGIDPSPQCAKDAFDKYGVNVVATPISQMAFAGERFDLVLLTSVIEHLRDAISSLREAASVVGPDGAIFVDAPDAARFADYIAAPYQQFSLEHVNYFSALSLSNAFRQIGYETSKVWHDERRDGPVVEPALSGLFRASTQPGAMVVDVETEPALRKYLAESIAAEKLLYAPIESARSSGRAVIIWGVGTLTLRLLATDAFHGLHIAAFVDSNRNYQGKKIRDIPILPPDALRTRPETILICSRAHQREITQQIRSNLGLKNPVITLFKENKEETPKT